jgi:uncharacterized damage-inducible protein DinB
MLQHVLNTYAMNLKRAGMHVQDLSAEQMVQQPSGVINHPAWTLGHLAATADNLAKALGLESTFPDAWRDACKTGGTPSGNAADFPAKEQLLEQLTAQHERVAAALAAADAELLAQPHPHPRARQVFPTIGDYAVALTTSHEANHLGQMAAWRRAMGLGSATGI